MKSDLPAIEQRAALCRANDPLGRRLRLTSGESHLVALETLAADDVPALIEEVRRLRGAIQLAQYLLGYVLPNCGDEDLHEAASVLDEAMKT